MYQAHFGLKKGLFDNGIAQGESVFLGAKQQVVVANSGVALTTLDSVVVLTGAAGVGKTTVASAALRESSTRLAIGWLGGTPANASELLDLLLAEFGVDAPRAGRMERLQMWRQFLNETNATDSRVFVIVERADDMSVALLRSLESFTAADPNGCAGANVVLLGEQTVTELLKSPALDSLRQRIRLRQKLEPLTVDELRAYLDHHVTLAGGVLDKVFTTDAVAAIHGYTRGIPRLVNNLCETALTLAATRREQRVTSDLVAKVATSLLGLDEPARAPQITESTAEDMARSAAPQPAASTAAAGLDVRTTAAARATPPPRPAAAAHTVQRSTATLHSPSQPAAPSPPAQQATPSIPTAAAAPATAASRPAAPAPPRTAQATQSATRTAAPPRHVTTAPATAASAPAKAAPAARTSGSAALEFDGDATDVVAEQLLTDTLADETPDVPMADFPLLTDAVDAPAPRARPERPDSAAAVAKPAVPPQPAQSARPASPEPSPKTAAAPVRAPQPNSATSKAAGDARPTPPKQRSTDTAAEAEVQETKTGRALASAKSIDDISNSMAETLFGEADLDELTSALAAGTWEEDGETAAPPSAEKTGTDDSDGFDLFDLGPDAPLELIDDSSLPPQVGGRKLVNDRR